jgi:hypothetical protein
MFALIDINQQDRGIGIIVLLNISCRSLYATDHGALVTCRLLVFPLLRHCSG